MSAVNSPLLYGSIINLQAGSSTGAYLTKYAKIPDVISFAASDSARGMVLTSSTIDNTAGSGNWEIRSATKKDGEPLLYGDQVYLSNLHPDMGYLDSCRYTKNIPSLTDYPEMIGVFTSKSKNRDSSSGSWTISSATGSKQTGEPVNQGDSIFLQNAYPDAGKLCVYGAVSSNPAFSGYDKAKSFVFCTYTSVPQSTNDTAWTVTNSTKLLDTNDAATAQRINTFLKKFKITSLIDTSLGTVANPKVVKCGYVFCDFSDKTGNLGDINTNFNLLNGIDQVSNTNIVADFINKESNGTVKLDIAQHSDNSTKWIRLPKTNADYVGNLNTLFADVDTLVEIPDEWQILFLAFPKGATAIASSQMCGERLLDQNQKINIVFLDPNLYNEADNNTPWTTVHEVMHALGLPDLYETSSYGWSLMSDCRTGWHITGFEKLVLGWHKLSDYHFLESGTIKANIFDQSAGEGTKKGIIVMPDTVRKECYFVEKAQAVGRTVVDVASFDRNGLLLMMADPSLRDISPFVSERGDSTTNLKFGGAGKAPFISGQSCTTMGISLFYHDSDPYVRVNSSYTVPDSAQSLRENEYIKTSDSTVVFKMDMFGMLTAGSDRLKLDGKLLNGKSTNKMDYGFTVYVDRKGIVHWIADISQTDSSTNFLYPTNTPSPLPDGDYFFKVEKDPQSDDYRVAVYAGKIGDTQAVYKYTLFAILKADISRGWETPVDENKCIIRFQNDGNLCLYSKNDDNTDKYRWSLYKSTESRKPVFAEWEDSGELIFYYDDDTPTNSVTKSLFSAAQKGTRPFALKSKLVGTTYSIVVVDGAGAELYALDNTLDGKK
ncbi:hypothetical protein J2I47_06525 [Fibrella sp. HMF5335]|uniref:M6 family metalloprotease domain-containing protein n=1 Tax=Fibrella rubiginis TaxID=2817060 RepID=A0A939GD68_9BACT|nr:hypothetical protein [Fibrella rubiginis]MBO0936196.1 hypothetical protein [Fibrella rubiginis]